jgi:hypothetical protein
MFTFKVCSSCFLGGKMERYGKGEDGGGTVEVEVEGEGEAAVDLGGSPKQGGDDTSFLQPQLGQSLY